MAKIVKYECIQCNVLHKGTEIIVPKCIMCSTSARMQKIEENAIFHITIDYGHNKSLNFYVNENMKARIRANFKDGKKMTIDFWGEECDVNMEFVQDIHYEHLTPKIVNNFEETMRKNLDEYGVTFNRRRTSEDWV